MRATTACVYAVLLAMPSALAADAVHAPEPIRDCPLGSSSYEPMLGGHGAFAYCAPRLCASDAACSAGLRCREAALRIERRAVGRTGRGAAPTPARFVSFVAGPCADPTPGIAEPEPDDGSQLGPPNIAPGCRRVQVCLPRGRGEPLGTTPRHAAVPPAPSEPAPSEPAPSEPPPSEPAPSAPAVDPPEGRVQARPHDGPQYARRAGGDPPSEPAPAAATAPPRVDAGCAAAPAPAHGRGPLALLLALGLARGRTVRATRGSS